MVNNNPSDSGFNANDKTNNPTVESAAQAFFNQESVPNTAAELAGSSQHDAYAGSGAHAGHGRDGHGGHVHGHGRDGRDGQGHGHDGHGKELAVEGSQPRANSTTVSTAGRVHEGAVSTALRNRLRAISKWLLIVGFIGVIATLIWVRIHIPVTPSHQDDEGYEVVEGTINDVFVLNENVVDDDPNFPKGTRELQIGATLTDGRKINVTLIDETGLYKVGVKAKFQNIPSAEAERMWIITDIVRGPSLILLAVVFALVVIALSKWQGVLSLVGLVLSGVIIVGVVIPAILAGYNPVVIALLGAMGIMWLTLPLAHGFNWTTVAAMVGTGLALLLTGVITVVSVWATSLTGLAQENIRSLRYSLTSGIELDVKGLLIAGMIIGVLGILDDVTVAQSSTVAQLRKANPHNSAKATFLGALQVGRDHISASVNTLFLAYAGAALPLLLLINLGELSMMETITSEAVAQEIVRTIAGSIGLISAVPLTTGIAVLLVSSDDPNLGGHSH